MKLEIIEKIGRGFRRFVTAAFDIRGWGGFMILALAGLALRYYLAPHPGYEYDMHAFSHWAAIGRPLDFFRFYSGPAEPKLSFPNYALYFPILAVLGTAADAATEAGRVLLRTPAIIGDILLAAVVYVSAKPKWKLVAAGFIIFNPVIWFDSAVFGQVDSLHTVFMALAVLFASDRKYRRAWLMAALAVCFKIQAIAILPLIGALHFKDLGIKKMATGMLPAVVCGALIALPYIVSSSLPTVWRSLFNSVGMYPLVSINAWNPWYLLHAFSGRWVYDHETVLGVTYQQIGLFAFIAALFAVIHLLPKRPSRNLAFLAAAAMCFSFYILLTEMHERYSYFILPFLAVAAAESPLVAAVAVLASFVIFLDINLVLPWSSVLGPLLDSVKIGVFWSIFLTVLFAAVFCKYVASARAEKKAAD